MRDRPAKPRLGTRPRNRRNLILAAAAELFARKGYTQVSMTEIADAVGVQSSALYRHFSSKNEILQGAINMVFESKVDVPGPGLDQSFEAALERLLAASRDHPWSGVLWQRESRNLPLTVRADISASVREVVENLGKALSRERPKLGDLQIDMLAWSCLAIALGSFNLRDGISARDEQLVQQMIRSVAEAHIPIVSVSTVRETVRVDGFRSRREALLAAAISLFAEHGYAAVSLDDVGTVVGIAGPSIYTHFPRKSDLLSAALHRASEVLWMDMSRVMALAEDEKGALVRLLQSYITFALSSVDFIQLIRAEVPQLPDEEKIAYVQRQNQYVAEWVHLLRTVHPEYSSSACETRVRTTLYVFNGIARRPHLRGGGGVHRSLEILGMDLLGLR